MLASSSAPWAVIDAKHDFTLGDAPIVRSFNPKLERQIIRVPLGAGEEELWDSAIWAAWDRGNGILYVDETTLLTPARVIRPSLGAAIRTGRSRGLGVWCGSQRPKDIPSAIFTEAEHFFLFQLTFEADREKVVSFTSPVIEDALSSLRGHDFIYWNILEDRGTYVRAA